LNEDRDELLDLYRCMVKIRVFEDTAHTQFLAGAMPGFLHLYSGEEAVAVGVMAALRADDFVTSTHRGHGHLIARGGDVNLMMAEIYGKATGYCRGKGGSMHVADVKLGVLGANGVVGASIPIGTGAALACQFRGDGAVSVTFFGDGATNRGTFHESLNLASVWQLPAVYVCENNLYGVANCQREHMNICDIADRAKSYGMPGVVVDGNDVLAVREATAGAVGRAREGGGPTLVECKTWRHHGHFVGDAAAYRDPAEHQEWMQKDPIPRFAAELTAGGHATADDLRLIEAEIASELEAAVAFAAGSPWPTEADLLTDVYTD
jgi:TPP-dependent pyruvate/acetoin dehydrogenase alpha subunit